MFTVLYLAYLSLYLHFEKVYYYILLRFHLQPLLWIGIKDNIYFRDNYLPEVLNFVYHLYKGRIIFIMCGREREYQISDNG